MYFCVRPMTVRFVENGDADNIEDIDIDEDEDEVLLDYAEVFDRWATRGGSMIAHAHTYRKFTAFGS